MNNNVSAKSSNRPKCAPGAARCLEVVLALVLFAAAILKALQLFEDSAPVLRQFLASKTVLFVLIETELLLATWLLVKGAPQSRFYCAIVCFCVFTAVAFYEALHNLPTCGCFGNVKVSPVITAAFDISAVCALWWTRPPKAAVAESPIPQYRLAIGVIATTCMSILLWTGYIFKVKSAMATIQNSDLVVLEPATWLNEPFPLLDEINGATPLRNGRWIILLYHHDCDSCLQAIPEYRSLADNKFGRKDLPHIAFVAIPPIVAPANDPVLPSSVYLRLTLRPNHDWFATTPIVIALQDGRVLFAAAGEQAIHPPNVPQWQN